MTYRTLDTFFSSIFKPGAVMLTTGERGGGKTHTAVAVAEYLVKGAYRSIKHVVVCTNIIFFQKVNGSIITGTPDNVYHIVTMKELFPIVAESIEKYGRDVLILLILDEAQDFIGGDSNMNNASIMMKRFLGTIRKYNVAVWFLTPTSFSIGPSFRNTINDERHPGNLTCKWSKDPSITSAAITSLKLNCKPNELIIVEPYDGKPVLLRIPVTEWTKNVANLKEGEYCYDHIASATFYEGDDFDWDEFNRLMGGVSSLEAIDVMRSYCYNREHTNYDMEIETAPCKNHKKIVEDAIQYREETGCSWKDAADHVGVSQRTLFNWRKETVAN